jgi:hypothetical protein
MLLRLYLRTLGVGPSTHGNIWKQGRGRMISPEQSIEGRRLLGWSRARLASRASVGETTVRKFELGLATPRRRNVVRIQAALELAGIQFTGWTECYVRLPIGAEGADRAA